MNNAKSNVCKKLVRDKIPSIVKQKGLQVLSHVCDEQEFNDRLRDKLQEEVGEFLQDNTVEELIDILEVVYALAAIHNTSPQQLEIMRSKKANERGGFDKRIVIDEVKKKN